MIKYWTYLIIDINVTLIFSWIVVDKRTVLNENRERVHVRWTAKRGNEIDLIGQLNVAWLLGHSGGGGQQEMRWN